MELNQLLNDLKEKVIDSIEDTYSSIWNITVEQDEYLAEDIKNMIYALYKDIDDIFDKAKTND